MKKIIITYEADEFEFERIVREYKNSGLHLAEDRCINTCLVVKMEFIENDLNAAHKEQAASD